MAIVIIPLHTPPADEPNKRQRQGSVQMTDLWDSKSVEGTAGLRRVCFSWLKMGELKLKHLLLDVYCYYLMFYTSTNYTKYI